MCKVWTISELGMPHFVVGIAVSWDWATCTIALLQTALIDKVVEQVGQKEAHPVFMPLEPGSKL